MAWVVRQLMPRAMSDRLAHLCQTLLDKPARIGSSNIELKPSFGLAGVAARRSSTERLVPMSRSNVRGARLTRSRKHAIGDL